ncbi:putative germin-like protein 2-1 [Chenopodium quinoa]|uniref:Germin-like protein n=1 Tax=Chenopodium quinoa TaxID=63459 RepID=A0A803MSI6_CHEQI|nr:putative germin-like protein 2-1 [Chenopodium quinoa]XP_021758340.1 putative germin-like protein 2-1 [Chenopodium quinoa]XP_021758341.1 putative germin-like protein 2-1 [Chenopodium quinoa]
MEMNNHTANLFMVVALLSITTHLYVANAADPSMLQDFCVGTNDPNASVFVNGKFCKNPKDVEIDDFIHKGFHIRGDTNNALGAEATLVDVTRFPALNTLGVALARVDFAPFGLNTPHLHPRGSEIFAVLERTLYAGVVTTNYTLYDTVLRKGDMIVFPQGLIHFQLNLGRTKAFAVASFGSQNPGRVNIADGVFGTRPRILGDVLTKGFQVDETVIERLRA